MDTALVDLGSVSVAPSYARAMRGYIALSRVRKVDDLLLAQPFSPALFQQGQQPWAALLLDTFKGVEICIEHLMTITKYEPYWNIYVRSIHYNFSGHKLIFSFF